jgi:hypothetical protein
VITFPVYSLLFHCFNGVLSSSCQFYPILPWFYPWFSEVCERCENGETLNFLIAKRVSDLVFGVQSDIEIDVFWSSFRVVIGECT